MESGESGTYKRRHKVSRIFFPSDRKAAYALLVRLILPTMLGGNEHARQEHDTSHATKRFPVLLEATLTVHRHRGGHEEGEDEEGPRVGVLGPEYQSPHDEVKRHGNDTR